MDEESFIDITGEFMQIASTLPTGELICTPDFNLGSALGSCELLDPKSDLTHAMIQSKDDYPTPEYVIANRLFKSKQFAPAELLSICSTLLCFEALWLQGAPLANTFYTCIYILYPTSALPGSPALHLLSALYNYQLYQLQELFAAAQVYSKTDFVGHFQAPSNKLPFGRLSFSSLLDLIDNYLNASNQDVPLEHQEAMQAIELVLYFKIHQVLYYFGVLEHSKTCLSLNSPSGTSSRSKYDLKMASCACFPYLILLVSTASKFLERFILHCSKLEIGLAASEPSLGFYRHFKFEFDSSLIFEIKPADLNLRSALAILSRHLSANIKILSHREKRTPLGLMMSLNNFLSEEEALLIDRTVISLLVLGGKYDGDPLSIPRLPSTLKTFFKQTYLPLYMLSEMPDDSALLQQVLFPQLSFSQENEPHFSDYPETHHHSPNQDLIPATLKTFDCVCKKIHDRALSAQLSDTHSVFRKKLVESQNEGLISSQATCACKNCTSPGLSELTLARFPEKDLLIGSLGLSVSKPEADICYSKYERAARAIDKFFKDFGAVCSQFFALKCSNKAKFHSSVLKQIMFRPLLQSASAIDTFLTNIFSELQEPLDHKFLNQLSLHPNGLEAKEAGQHPHAMHDRMNAINKMMMSCEDLNLISTFKSLPHLSLALEFTIWAILDVYLTGFDLSLYKFPELTMIYYTMDKILVLYTKLAEVACSSLSLTRHAAQIYRDLFSDAVPQHHQYASSSHSMNAVLAAGITRSVGMGSKPFNLDATPCLHREVLYLIACAYKSIFKAYFDASIGIHQLHSTRRCYAPLNGERIIFGHRTKHVIALDMFIQVSYDEYNEIITSKLDRPDYTKSFLSAATEFNTAVRFLNIMETVQDLKELGFSIPIKTIKANHIAATLLANGKQAKRKVFFDFQNDKRFPSLKLS